MPVRIEIHFHSINRPLLNPLLKIPIFNSPELYDGIISMKEI